MLIDPSLQIEVSQAMKEVSKSTLSNFQIMKIQILIVGKNVDSD